MDETAAPATTNGHIPPASSGVRLRIGQAGLLIGNVLLAVSLFTPWLDVTGDDYGHSPVWIHYNYGPLYLVQRDIPGIGFWLLASPLLLVLVCLCGLFLCTFMLLTRLGRTMRGIFLFVLVICCGVAFFATLLGVLNAVPFWLSFGYPSYRSAPSTGVWLGLAGIIVVFLASAVAWPEGR